VRLTYSKSTVGSQYSKSSHSETIGPGLTVRVDLLSTHYSRTSCQKYECIRVTTAGIAFSATTLRPKFGTFSRRKLAVRKVMPLCGYFKHTLTQNIVLGQVIRLRTVEEEAFGITLTPSENCE